MPNIPAHRRMQSTVMANDMREAATEQTALIVGWDNFPPLVKQVLLMVPWTATETEACEQVGIHPGSWRKMKGRDPLIKEAIKQRRAFMTSFIRETAQELLSRSVFELSTMLDNKELEPKERLQVIDRIMKLTGFDKQQAAEPQQTQVNTFIKFDGSKSAPIEIESS